MIDDPEPRERPELTGWHVEVIRALRGRPTDAQLELIDVAVGSREQLCALRALYDAGDRSPGSGLLAVLALKRMARGFRLLGLTRRDVRGLDLGRARRDVRH